MTIVLDELQGTKGYEKYCAVTHFCKYIYSFFLTKEKYYDKMSKPHIVGFLKLCLFSAHALRSETV